MDLRYSHWPLPASRSQVSAAAERVTMINTIAATPDAMRAAVRGLTDAQLNTPYRPEGWTVRQVVHHLPDSQLNAYVRFKLALTEDQPTIKPYDEVRWAELPDRKGPIEPSVLLLESVHARWVDLLRQMTPADFSRTLIHPEHPGAPMTLDHMLAMYAWHGPHHVAHVTSARERNGWT